MGNMVDSFGLNKEQYNSSKEKLNKLDEIDRIKQERETSLNDLESFILNIREKLYEDIYEKSSTEEEREKINEKGAELSDWIDEEVGPFTEIDILKSKLEEIKALTKDLFARVEEHKGRPEILEALNSMVNSSEHFLAKAKNDTKNKAPEDAYFTENEVELLEKKINETKKAKIRRVTRNPKKKTPKIKKRNQRIRRRKRRKTKKKKKKKKKKREKKKKKKKKKKS